MSALTLYWLFRIATAQVFDVNSNISVWLHHSMSTVRKVNNKGSCRVAATIGLVQSEI